MAKPAADHPSSPPSPIPADPLLAELLTLWPFFTPDQREKVLAYVRRMKE
ncbi:MAG TPA: hypothetical protein VFE58_02565 [Tepidisphaeraceae bacterium]|nr:hypothetical protein [Tepidisphaeraceae bacterium]